MAHIRASQDAREVGSSSLWRALTYQTANGQGPRDFIHLLLSLQEALCQAQFRGARAQVQGQQPGAVSGFERVGRYGCQERQAPRGFCAAEHAQ